MTEKAGRKREVTLRSTDGWFCISSIRFPDPPNTNKLNTNKFNTNKFNTNKFNTVTSSIQKNFNTLNCQYYHSSILKQVKYTTS